MNQLKYIYLINQLKDTDKNIVILDKNAKY